MISSYSHLLETKTLWQECFDNSNDKFPFYSYAWHEAFFSTIGKQQNPFSIVLPELSIVAPFGTENTRVLFSGGKEGTDYLDLIGPEQNKIKAWKEILPYLKKLGKSELFLFSIPQSSSSLSFFQEIQEKFPYAIQIVQSETTPTIALPNSYNLYTASLPRKLRHELERKIRKFEREHDPIGIKNSINPLEDIDTLFLLMKKDERKNIFLTPEHMAFFRQLAEKFSEQIILQFLSIDNASVAVILGFISAHSFLLYNSGFDHEQFPGSGFYLKAKSVRYAIEHGMATYNFLRGNERYKYDLGGVDFGVFDITIDLHKLPL